MLKWLLTLLMIALIVPVTLQILSRYTGIIPRFIWTEEIARFCFVWIVLIGAMIAVRDDSHFTVDLLPQPKSALSKLVSRLFVHFATLVLALSFLIWGYDFGVLGSRQQSEISGLPMLAIYIAWPVAGATWTLFVIEKIIDDMSEYRLEKSRGTR
ncbi:MAG: TRAP transporter small permease [Granulosicoccus sp.]|nr:TRAP transporter small permease [Granulosicoccus sp.]